MPDAHQGYGMPISGVMATVDVIVSNAVGVDIGCGMIAAKTTSMADELDEKLLKTTMIWAIFGREYLWDLTGADLPRKGN